MISGKLDDRVGWRGQYRGWNEKYYRKVMASVRSAVSLRRALQEQESIEVMERIEAATLGMLWPFPSQLSLSEKESENDVIFANRLANIRKRLGLDNGTNVVD